MKKIYPDKKLVLMFSLNHIKFNIRVMNILMAYIVDPTFTFL